MRTLKDALEARLGTRVLTVPREGEPSSLVSWLTEYSAVLLNRYEVGHDGKTAYERLRGKKSKVLGVEFGEAVQWRKIIKGERQNKLDTVWDDGVYAGHKTVSGESIIATKGGFRKTRTIRRRPEEERWKGENLNCFIHFPWKVNDKIDEAEFVMEDLSPPVPSLRPDTIPDLPDVTVRQEQPRRMYVKIDDLRKHGFTTGCAGCTALEYNGPRTGHNDTCRQRIAGLIHSSPSGLKRVIEAKSREDNFLAEQIRKNETDKIRKTTTDPSDGATVPRDGGTEAQDPVPPVSATATDVATSTGTTGPSTDLGVGTTAPRGGVTDTRIPLASSGPD